MWALRKQDSEALSRFLKVLEVAATAVTRFLKFSAEERGETAEDVTCRAPQAKENA